MAAVAPQSSAQQLQRDRIARANLKARACASCLFVVLFVCFVLFFDRFVCFFCEKLFVFSKIGRVLGDDETECPFICATFLEKVNNVGKGLRFRFVEIS